MTAPPKDLKTARRIAVEEALGKEAARKPSASEVAAARQRIARLARLFVKRYRATS